MAQTQQVKDAIKAMREAGFERSEFSVNVKRHRYTSKADGRRVTEYGDAEVTVWASMERLNSKIREICKAGLGVVSWYSTFDGKRRLSSTVSASYEHRGSWWLRDLDAEYGTDAYFGRYEFFRLHEGVEPEVDREKLNKDLADIEDRDGIVAWYDLVNPTYGTSAGECAQELEWDTHDKAPAAEVRLQEIRARVDAYLSA